MNNLKHQKNIMNKKEQIMALQKKIIFLATLLIGNSYLCADSEKNRGAQQRTAEWIETTKAKGPTNRGKTTNPKYITKKDAEEAVDQTLENDNAFEQIENAENVAAENNIIQDAVNNVTGTDAKIALENAEVTASKIYNPYAPYDRYGQDHEDTVTQIYDNDLTEVPLNDDVIPMDVDDVDDSINFNRNQNLPTIRISDFDKEEQKKNEEKRSMRLVMDNLSKKAVRQSTVAAWKNYYKVLQTRDTIKDAMGKLKNVESIAPLLAGFKKAVYEQDTVTSMDLENNYHKAIIGEYLEELSRFYTNNERLQIKVDDLDSLTGRDKIIIFLKTLITVYYNSEGADLRPAKLIQKNKTVSLDSLTEKDFDILAKDALKYQTMDLSEVTTKTERLQREVRQLLEQRATLDDLMLPVETIYQYLHIFKLIDQLAKKVTLYTKQTASLEDAMNALGQIKSALIPSYLAMVMNAHSTRATAYETRHAIISTDYYEHKNKLVESSLFGLPHIEGIFGSLLLTPEEKTLEQKLLGAHERKNVLTTFLRSHQESLDQESKQKLSTLFKALQKATEKSLGASFYDAAKNEIRPAIDIAKYLYNFPGRIKNMLAQKSIQQEDDVD